MVPINYFGPCIRPGYQIRLMHFSLKLKKNIKIKIKKIIKVFYPILRQSILPYCIKMFVDRRYLTFFGTTKFPSHKKYSVIFR